MNNSNLVQVLAGGVFIVSSTIASAASDKDKIGDFLADLSPGSVSAAEIIGLQASAVTTIHAPKDVVAAIGGLTSEKAKQGVGISFTPARTRLAPVSIGDYGTRTLSRVWAGATFSYAQNRQPYGGIEYKQDAVALHGAWYLDKDDDPSVAMHSAFAKCVPVREAMGSAVLGIAKFTEAVRQEIIAAQRAAGASEAQAKAKADEIAEELAKPRAAELRREMREIAVEAAAVCVDGAKAKSAAKWNASQMSLTLGAGWVKGPGGSSQRHSLGRSLNISAALYAGSNGLANVTLKRISRAIDTESLTGTPLYKNSTLAALRYTYGYGDKAGLFVLAEISNAKGSQATVGNSAFKAAFGIDKRMFDGGWIEFRVGRKRSSESGKEEAVGLINIKLSPGASIPNL